MTTVSRRGFASMSAEKKRQIASKGGHARHAPSERKLERMAA
ncbi:hypothetical protein EPN28_00040 [Patescibacteria group bacterium]|nr:MAG: hypothetical protein EPN28_00040 [Patescibacteria group bacterium]